MTPNDEDILARLRAGFASAASGFRREFDEIETDEEDEEEEDTWYKDPIGAFFNFLVYYHQMFEYQLKLEGPQIEATHKHMVFEMNHSRGTPRKMRSKFDDGYCRCCCGYTIHQDQRIIFNAAVGAMHEAPAQCIAASIRNPESVYFKNRDRNIAKLMERANQ